MPNIISFTELVTTPADGDYLPIIDVSDTTFDPAGTDKKVSVATLRDAMGGLWVKNGGDIEPIVSTYNLDMLDGVLKDTNVTGGIGIGQVSDPALVGFTKTSIVGALNELKTEKLTSPLTTKGDIHTYSTVDARLPVGTNGQILVADSTALTGIKWQTSLVGDKEIFISGTEYSSNLGNYRTRSIGAAASYRFTFSFPYDLTTIVSLQLVGIISAGAAGAARNIDFNSEYGAIGEVYNTHTGADTTSTYNLTGLTNQLFGFNLAPIFASATGGDFAGVLVTHNAIGGAIDYIGVKLRYN